ARAVQGTAAALLVPGSLALMRAAYREEDQGKAIGLWSGLSGVTSALGPIAGGWLAEAISWRAIFFLNLPLAAACLFATARFVPTLHRQERLGYSPLQAGLVLTPVTVLLLLLSPLAAKVAGRIGSRWPMTAGSLIAGFGLALLSFLNDEAPSLAAILIAVIVF